MAKILTQKSRRKFVQFYLFCFVKPRCISELWKLTRGPVFCFCWLLKLSVFLEAAWYSSKKYWELEKSTKTQDGPSSQLTQLCCPKVFNKMEIFWHFHENFEVRYLEKVYNFSAILLQWNIIKFVERNVKKR